MDYEKKYKALVEAVKTLKKTNPSDEGIQNWVNDNVPELKESEDEEIKKALIKFHKSTIDIDGIKGEDIIDWLEKQGEQKYTKKDVDDAYLKGVTDTKNEIEKQYEETYQIRKDIATFIFNYKGDIKDRAKWIDYLGIKFSLIKKQSEKKSADNIEPKFKVKDWIVNTITKEIEQVIELTDCEYICSGHLIVSFNNQHLLKKWDIYDAKDGDVLATDSIICIFKKLDIDSCQIISHCIYTLSDGLEVFNNEDNGNYYCGFKPATKEDRELLFRKIKEAGYELDANKLKLRKIEQNPDDSYCKEHCKGYKETGKCFADGECDAKRKWTQNRYTWKPSSEQIKVLEFFIPYVTKCSVVLQKSKDTLLSLLADLKKLREE